MSGLEALYRELILDHARTPIGRRHQPQDDDLEPSRQRNPLCGDEIALRARVTGDRVERVSWEGAGCAISQASASMMVALVEGLTPGDATALVDAFRRSMRSRGTLDLDAERFGDAAALSGVSRFSGRVKCAMLAWVALEHALARAVPVAHD